MYKKYRRTNVAEMEEWNGIDTLLFLFEEGVSVSETDEANGSPSFGDMIARNPKNHEDKWLVAKKYFEDNFELMND